MTALPTNAEFATRMPLRNRRERTFDLHPALFAGTIAAYFAFLGIMALAFMNAMLAIPFSVFVAYIVMAFGVPALWALMAPDQGGRAADWDEWMAEGVDTGSGHMTGGAAVAQVMTLPLLVVAWGGAIALIATLP